MTVYFPAPPATSITRELRHKDFEQLDALTWRQPLYAQTVMHAIRAVTTYNKDLQP